MHGGLRAMRGSYRCVSVREGCRRAVGQNVVGGAEGWERVGWGVGWEAVGEVGG